MQNAQGTLVAERSKHVFVSGYFSIAFGAVIGGGLIVFGVLIYYLENLAELKEFAPFAIVAGAIFVGGFFAFSFPQLIVAHSCPQNLIVQNGDIFTCWCGRKLGYREVPASEIVSLIPGSGIMYSSWVMLVRGNVDSHLEILTAAGERYRVPCVRDVRAAMARMQALCTRPSPPTDDLPL